MTDMKLIADVNQAVQRLYDHVGFIPDYVMCPIDDCTELYWYVTEDTVVYCEDEEFGDSNSYEDTIYTQRFYTKWIYEGSELTMIFCDSQTDGMKWFRVFDNSKRTQDKT